MARVSAVGVLTVRVFSCAAVLFLGEQLMEHFPPVTAYADSADCGIIVLLCVGFVLAAVQDVRDVCGTLGGRNI
jgi:hypothetical protein